MLVFFSIYLANSKELNRPEKHIIVTGPEHIYSPEFTMTLHIPLVVFSAHKESLMALHWYTHIYIHMYVCMYVCMY